MQGLAAGIDHVGVLVRDMDEAEAAYRRLGFQLTSRGHHQRYGTCNHTIVFQDDYCELLGVYKSGPETDFIRQVLDRFEGLWLVAFACDDAHKVHDHLQSRRVLSTDAQDYDREVVIDGETRLARFTSVQVSPVHVPGTMPIFCQHHTPELVWHSEFQRHANGATGIGSLTLVVSDLGPALDPYRAFFERDIEAPATEPAVLTMGRQQIRFVPKTAFDRELSAASIEPMPYAPPYIGGMALRVSDLARTASFLEAQGIEASRSDAGLTVGPQQACGAVLTFYQDEPGSASR